MLDRGIEREGERVKNGRGKEVRKGDKREGEREAGG